ncbi:MAG: hypothetical protein A2X86_05580 [Bdellovibrionales bacterium GWA2_49_15]|nr:MAG: hypothetical protein A2X86_05580 [Bdellovibrionales bacterium GWA2_49_15]
MQDNLGNYLSRARRSSDFLKHSIKTTLEDIYFDSKQLILSPGPTQLFQLTKDAIGSTGWMANSALKHFLTLSGLLKAPDGIKGDVEAEFIVKKVSKNIPLDPKRYPPAKIFSALYRELEFSYVHPNHKSRLQCPKIFPTIVLVSGVLNEIYKTASFERGVQNIGKKNNLKYIVATVSGVKGSDFNSGQLAEQLFEYHKHHPDEKFWFLTYSKGGIDVLYFLRDHAEWSCKNVVGISTLATPILGSRHLNKRYIRMASKLKRDLSEFGRNYLGQELDFFSEAFQRSISTKQRSWFFKNYHKLPTNIFYTALALSCNWHEGHIYMMLAKLMFPSDTINDGVVDADCAFFPKYFNAINLGIYHGHHLIAARSSSFSQEALIEAHLILLKYKYLI